MRAENKLFWDLETTVKNKGDESIGDFHASPFHPKNFIVLHQLAINDGSVLLYDFRVSNKVEGIYKEALKETDIVIGHNIKFDLLYAKRFHPVWNKWLRTGKIYDTQLAEYLISGHTVQYSSLNDLALKYGGTQKDDRIKEYWAQGFETEDIPRDQLEEYGRYDVINTRLVYEAQQKTIQRLGIQNLIEANMEALLATTEMEFNGMCFDSEFANQERARLEAEQSQMKAELLDILKPLFPEDFPLNLNSSDHLSAALFGGPWKYTRKEPMTQNGKILRYGPKAQKAGEIRYKNIELNGRTKGLELPPKEQWKAAKEGVYFTNEDVLQVLKHWNKDVPERILKLRELEKDINTYFKRYSELVWPDDCIHGKLNHTATGTGRLSSSSPNLQNLTKQKD